jgi:hypothetical protein
LETYGDYYDHQRFGVSGEELRAALAPKKTAQEKSSSLPGDLQTELDWLSDGNREYVQKQIAAAAEIERIRAELEEFKQHQAEQQAAKQAAELQARREAYVGQFAEVAAATLDSAGFAEGHPLRETAEASVNYAISKNPSLQQEIQKAVAAFLEGNSLLATQRAQILKAKVAEVVTGSLRPLTDMVARGQMPAPSAPVHVGGGVSAGSPQVDTVPKGDRRTALTRELEAYALKKGVRLL